MNMARSHEPDKCLGDALSALEAADKSRAALRLHATRMLSRVEEFVDTGQFERVSDATAETAVSRTARHRPASNRSVLLAEDDAGYARKLAGLMARELGVEVVVAGSVSAALEALSGRHFDAVVADLDLGDGLGVEVIEGARRLDDAVVSIVMSSYLQPHLDSVASRCGAEAQFDKTQPTAVLVETMRRVLSQPANQPAA